MGSSGVVHDAVWRAAERVRAAGMRLAICTGRPAFGLTGDLARRLDPDGWHIFQNGASVLHLPTSHSVSVPIAPDIVTMLIERARRLGRELELYSDLDYAVESTSDRARLHATLLGLPFTPRPLDSFEGPIVRAQWLLSSSEARIALAEPHPGLEVSASTSPRMPDVYFTNLTPTGINKASAVRAVTSEYGLSLDEVMFVGDGWNDTVAMRIVGWPVAMANAETEALEIARHVIGHVDDGGLAEGLELALAS